MVLCPFVKIRFQPSYSNGCASRIEISVIKTNNNDIIVVSGIDNEAVTSFASKIRDYRRPEPYKGKG